MRRGRRWKLHSKPAPMCEPHTYSLLQNDSGLRLGPNLTWCMLVLYPACLIMGGCVVVWVAKDALQAAVFVG